MADSLPHDAAHALAGGGAQALRGTFPERTLRAAFASGPNTAAGAAGVVAVVGGVLVLALLRAPGAVRTGVTETAAKTLTEETAPPAELIIPTVRAGGDRVVQIRWRLRVRNLRNRQFSVRPFPM
jgi:hypothetical protein